MSTSPLLASLLLLLLESWASRFTPVLLRGLGRYLLSAAQHSTPFHMILGLRDIIECHDVPEFVKQDLILRAPYKANIHVDQASASGLKRYVEDAQSRGSVAHQVLLPKDSVVLVEGICSGPRARPLGTKRACRYTDPFLCTACAATFLIFLVI